MYLLIEDHYRANAASIAKNIAYRAGGREDAEDIVQEAYCRALKYIHAFNPNEFEFQRWFSRLFSNVWKDAIAEKYQRGRPQELDETHEQFICNNFKSNAPQLMELIYDEILATENEDHREVLTLYLIYGYQLKEVAEITDIRSGTVNQILFRFKDGLKKTYG